MRFGLDDADPANQRLLNEAHPAGWVNPDPASKYHLVVLGGGTAGLVAAIGAASLGAKVAIVEKRLLGGDCLNWGCVPSKALLTAAKAWHYARKGSFGAPVSSGDGDFTEAMRIVREARAHIAPHDGASRLSSLGVDVFLGEGAFESADSLRVGETLLRFRKAVIATGARPLLPQIEGLDGSDVLTNESIFEITERPEHLMIIGGGPIGCEVAQAFARFGSRVTIVESGERILSHDEPDAAAVVRGTLEREGVTIRTSTNLARVRRESDAVFATVQSDGRDETIRISHLLAAAGRAPNIDGLGLDRAGVEYDRNGVTVDDHLRTSNRNIFASGDVASSKKFTHLADAQSRIVIMNSLFPGRARATRLVVPWCTYTSPELAQTGLTREAARDSGVAIDETTVAFAEIDRALLENDSEGFLRVLTRRGSGKIVGATAVGEHAGEIISTLTLAIVSSVGLDGIGSVIFPYPTRSEIIRRAADTWRRRKLTPAVRRALAAWFRVRG